jgi:OHCU decarboxylase
LSEHGLGWLNSLPAQEAESEFYACLANRRWAADLVAGRPYRGVDRLLDAAALRMHQLSEQDWIAAFKAHPRIGERGGDAPASSDREQSRVVEASAATRAALATGNRQYEERFGHVFLIAASGRSPDEILSELRRRMKNDPETELREARRELATIARMRLQRLLV